MLTSLPACRTDPIIRTKIVEVKVPVQTPLPATLLVKEPKPERPPARCVDAKGRATLCNRDLADWLRAYDALVDRMTARLDQVIGLQPKGE